MEGAELPSAGKPFERFLLPGGGIPLNQINHLGLQHEEPAVNPTSIPLGLLLKAPHIAVRPHLQRAVTTGRLNGGEGGEALLLVVEGYQGAHIHISNAISIGEAECLIANIILHPPQPASRHG